ncbi:hypothetical protein WJX72_000761 [[Myrmecia] bisecta]|uniref:Uncharacterized protein n=1 Tax=[Myrmecia] bisecta TaxID=41462 RepID=A0AAW1PE46_9CHLO
MCLPAHHQSSNRGADIYKEFINGSSVKVPHALAPSETQPAQPTAGRPERLFAALRPDRILVQQLTDAYLSAGPLNQP